MTTAGFATRRSLTADLRNIGLREADTVFVHAALRKVGPIVGGPDIIVGALFGVLGPSGTILGYTDWQGGDEDRLTGADRSDIPPFDPMTSRATRSNGYWPELLRTTPGALRSASPGASCAAIGGRAEWFTAGHALDYGYGPHSPFGKLVEAEGKVLMLGAPLDTMTLLHHAEHLARIPHRVLRFEAPILTDGNTVWRWCEEYDTANPPDGLAEDYMATLVTDFLATGRGQRGTIGAAPSVLVSAHEIVPFATDWLERRLVK